MNMFGAACRCDLPSYTMEKKVLHSLTITKNY
jgi:hypothetical protein